MLKELLGRWPVVKQIQNRDIRATGETAWSNETHKLQARHVGAEATPSICPYCGVGCGQVVYHRGNDLINIEGDPTSPISRGHLCPKGANTFQLHTHPGRLMTVKYRKPFGSKWEELPLDRAMEMVADRVWETRERTFQEKKEDHWVMQTTAIAHLGGATLDNEENYIIKKLFAGGLGMVCVSNQARI